MNEMKNVKVMLGVVAAASAGTQVDTATIDTAGYEGVMFLGSVATANAGNYAKLQSDTASGFGTAADVLGSKVVPATSGDSFLIDVFRPLKRYWKCSIIRAGTNTVTGDVYVILYGPKKKPTTHGATIVAADQKQLVSPIDGTP
jgi:hypothetical protein